MVRTGTRAWRASGRLITSTCEWTMSNRSACSSAAIAASIPKTAVSPVDRPCQAAFGRTATVSLPAVESPDANSVT